MYWKILLHGTPLVHSTCRPVLAKMSTPTCSELTNKKFFKKVKKKKKKQRKEKKYDINHHKISPLYNFIK